MNKLTKLQKYDLLIFATYCGFSLYEVVKYAGYAIQHKWINDLYPIISVTILVMPFILWFITSYIFHTKQNAKILTLLSNVICFVALAIKNYNIGDLFRQLFVEMDFLPIASFIIDKCTSMFELIFIIAYTIIFIVYFIYQIKIGVFKKPKPPLS